MTGNHSLVFTNLNQKACRLIYQLNFVGAPPLDPRVQIVADFCMRSS